MVDKEKINEAKEKLGCKAFFIMAEEIPLECVDEKKMCCKSPFKDENTPSAYWFKDGNFLKCFATDLKMDYIDFSIKYHNNSFSEAVKELFDLVGMDYNESDFLTDIKKDFKFASDEPENDRGLVEAYLLKRNISPETLDFCNVKQSISGDIAYQFYDQNNRLIQTKYRVAKKADNGDRKWYWQHGADVCPMLYGINRINFSSPVVIVEGMNDRLACVESGYSNCVSIPGGAGDKNWIEYNFDFLEKCQEVILWFDDDVVGQENVKECANRIGIYKTKIVKVTEDVKAKVREYFQKYNSNKDKVDANNVLVCCGQQDVLKLISNAEDVKNEHLKKLFGYKEIELINLPHCTTGFAELDRIVYGSFDNTFIVLTGYSGCGKSTLISEMGIIAPMEAKKKVMIYSGEAQGGILLGNTLRPLASNRHIIEYDNSSKGIPNGYAVTFQAKEAIKKYYMDYLYNYDDGDGLSSSSDEILESMEYAYRKYGVTFFTLDNLMTITTSDSDADKYSSQIKFAKSLKSFTRKYPVTVILVAHPKKPAPGQNEVDMYGISGSSEIINLADRAYSVGILKEDADGYNSYISILKDRQTGKSNKKIKMYYDASSTRIYSSEQELKKKYSWEYNFDPEYDTYTLTRLVKDKSIKESDVSEVLGDIQ